MPRRGLFRIAVIAGLVLALLTVPACGHGFEDHDDEETVFPPPPSLPDIETNDTQIPSSDDDGEGISLAGSKIAAIFIMITLCSVSTIAPYFVRFSMEVVAYGTLFGAGLFFSLAVMHFIPDSDYGFRYLVPGNEQGHAYPYAYLLVVGGYLLTQVAEMVAHALLVRRSGIEHSHDYMAGLIGRPLAQIEPGEKAPATVAEPRVAPPKEKLPSDPVTESQAVPSCCMQPLTDDSGASNGDSDSSESPLDKPCCGNNETYDLADIRICGQECNNCGNPMCQVMDCCGEACQCEPGHCRCAKADTSEPAVSALPGSSIIEAPSAMPKSDILHLPLLELSTLLLAMCFHSVFEGLVIGLAASAEAVWSLTSSIVIHKGFEGLALGMSILVSGAKRPLRTMAWYALGFAASTPTGIIVGIILDRTSTGFTAKWIITIVNGLAAGVFIFVSLSHVAPKAYAMRSCNYRSYTPFARLLAFVLGVTVIALIQLKDH